MWDHIAARFANKSRSIKVLWVLRNVYITLLVGCQAKIGLLPDSCKLLGFHIIWLPSFIYNQITDNRGVASPFFRGAGINFEGAKEPLKKGWQRPVVSNPKWKQKFVFEN